MEGDASPSPDREFCTKVDESVRPSQVVITALAESEDASPDELDVTLYDYLDPDALNDLFRSSDGPLSVTFELDSHTVTLRRDDEFHVRITDTNDVNRR